MAAADRTRFDRDSTADHLRGVDEQVVGRRTVRLARLHDGECDGVGGHADKREREGSRPHCDAIDGCVAECCSRCGFRGLHGLLRLQKQKLKHWRGFQAINAPNTALEHVFYLFTP